MERTIVLRNCAVIINVNATNSTEYHVFVCAFIETVCARVVRRETYITFITLFEFFFRFVSGLYLT